MAGVSKCMKYSMFIFNFFFWVCGCIILGFSIWIRVSSAQQVNACNSSMLGGVNLLIAVGAIIMILGFLGCCGAVKESRCMLMLFFIALLLILILQVTAGVLGAVYKPQVQYYFIYQCCGLKDGPEDWGQNFDKQKDICQCEVEKPSSSDLCTTYRSRYVYKKVRKMFTPLSKEPNFNPRLSLVTGLVRSSDLLERNLTYCEIHGRMSKE
uniref:Uncharacterized protein n=1 Tax=Geospiza parvula TaxID=87175 RepID=A0A8C3NIX5_GEOPR